MKSVDYFEDILLFIQEDSDREYNLFSKLNKAFITPIDSEDIFELYLIAKQAKENKNKVILKIIEKICLNRSLKVVEKEIYKYFRNTDERELIEKICKIVLKNS